MASVNHDRGLAHCISPTPTHIRTWTWSAPECSRNTRTAHACRACTHHCLWHPPKSSHSFDKSCEISTLDTYLVGVHMGREYERERAFKWQICYPMWMQTADLWSCSMFLQCRKCMQRPLFRSQSETQSSSKETLSRSRSFGRLKFQTSWSMMLHRVTYLPIIVS